MRKAFRFLVAVAAVYVLFTVAVVTSDTLSIPVTFTSGTIITAADFNTNFTAVANIVNGLIDDTNLKNDGITASLKIANGTIDLAAMGTGSVDSAKILDGSVNKLDHAANGVDEPALDIITAPSSATDGFAVVYDDATGRLDLQDKGVPGTCVTVIAMNTGAPAGACTGNIFVSMIASDDLITPSRNDMDGAEGNTDHWMAPVALTASNLRVESICAGGGEEDTMTVTLRDDLASTGLSCQTVVGTPSVCNDTDEIAIAAGSKLNILMTENQEGPTCDDCSEVYISFCLSPY